MKRFAIYYAPPPGPLADRAAEWLGWDPRSGQPVAQPDLPGLPAPLADLTRDPRKYGFHGTLRAPFRPAPGLAQAEVSAHAAALAARLAPVTCAGLQLVEAGEFLALVPQDDPPDLATLAARVVEATDALRAPLTEAEIARRRPDRLTPRQRALLDRWGYPFVMEEFAFHLTLTGPLSPADRAQVAAVAEPFFAPVLPRPFTLAALCLFGEAEDGRFHLLESHPFGG